MRELFRSIYRVSKQKIEKTNKAVQLFIGTLIIGEDLK